MDSPEPTASDSYDELVENLRKRAAARKASGEIPGDIEQKLAGHQRQVAELRSNKPPEDVAGAIDSFRNGTASGSITGRFSNRLSAELRTQLADLLQLLARPTGQEELEIRKALLNHIDLLYEYSAELAAQTNDLDDRLRALETKKK